MKREKEGILLESGTNEIEIMKFTSSWRDRRCASALPGRQTAI